jgi:hypothetical protein
MMKKEEGLSRLWPIFTLPKKIILFTVLVAFGAQSALTCVTNLTCTVLPYVEYRKNGSDAKWIRLKNCQIDSLGMCWRTREKSDRIDEVYFPVRLPGEDSSARIHVLLAARDPVSIDLAERQRVASSELEMINYATIRKLPWNENRDVEGLIRHGFDMSDRDVAELQLAISNLAPNFVVIEDQAKPNFIVGLIFLVVSGALTFLISRRLYYRFSSPSVGPQRLEMPKE